MEPPRRGIQVELAESRADAGIPDLAGFRQDVGALAALAGEAVVSRAAQVPRPGEDGRAAFRGLRQKHGAFARMARPICWAWARRKTIRSRAPASSRASRARRYQVIEGCTNDFAHANLSWITADQAYLARVTPSPETINDLEGLRVFRRPRCDGKPVWTRISRRSSRCWSGTTTWAASRPPRCPA